MSSKMTALAAATAMIFAADAETGDPDTEFCHLERAHVLGQRSTAQHVRVHLRMLAAGLRRRDFREARGQIIRVVGAAAKTWAGLIPDGNTGGADVSPFKPMPVAQDLAPLTKDARA